jgi:hypothetical protein
MIGVKRYGRIYQDDRLNSKAFKKPNVSMMIKDSASLMMNSTPLWPISEKSEEINHGSPKKNVCNTLPSFIRNNSRQGKRLPAKGKVSDFRALSFCSELRKIDDRVVFEKSMGGRQTTVSLLTRCLMMVDSWIPERPHLFFGGAKMIEAEGMKPAIHFHHRRIRP